MKPTNTRQKQQIQGFVQHSRLDKHTQHNPKGKSDIPHVEDDQSKESSSSKPQEGQTVHHTGPKIGRNDPCSCGSGKKYKKCCLGKSDS